MKKEYSNGELTVVWKPELCAHAGECVKRLPNVYRPNEKPWINLQNANSEALIRQINHCPSGALSYYLNENKINKSEAIKNEVKLSVIENGPLMVKGLIQLKDKDGKVITRDKNTAFCRCGSSQNKPFCDGKHKETGFRG